MKKTGLLLLLVPTLFLASCQTTPKVDTITEEEARTFIEEHFTKKVEEFTTPSNQSLVKWKITKDSDDGKAKIIIGNYIFNDNRPITDQDGNKGLTIEDTRCAQYINDLKAGTGFGGTGADAVIGMNKDIFEKLYQSTQRETGVYNLVYKPAGKGLKIISESAIQKTIYTRTHHYNEVGQETKFEINANKEDSTVVFTMSIDFKY